MKSFYILASLACVMGLQSFAASPPEYEPLKADAEKLYADGSYAKAHEAYGQAVAMNLDAGDRRWVDFRLADTLWRSEVATQTADTTQLDAAQRELESQVRDITRTEDHDRVWAEVEESLGDFFWTRRNSTDWSQAWPHYQNALDWWAGAADIEMARARYLKMVWECAHPPQFGPRNFYYGIGGYGNALPLEILENAAKIAQSENDRAHAHYLIAMTLRNQGIEWEQRRRVPEEFEAAIKPGKTTDWYGDALYNYALWMSGAGRVVRQAEGGWTLRPDYVKALELYRRLMKEFDQGETSYWQQAQQQIKFITDPTLNVSVANVFLPDSEMQYTLNWRNVKQIEVAIYAVDLTKDVKLSGQDDRNENWLESIDLAGREKVKSWSRDTKDKGDYMPGNETVRLDGRLPAGAYVIEARGEGISSRDLLLVSDAAVVLKTSGNQALVYMCNALDSSPLADANVHLWERWMDDDKWHWRDRSKKTGADGIAVFDLEHQQSGDQIFAGATVKDRQAFGTAGVYFNNNPRRIAPVGPNGELYASAPTDQEWKIYATTDRPAYRPKETVQWKFTARRYDGSVYSTPSGDVVAYEIHDPRGAKVKEDKVTLNSFGSAWASLELTETMPLGEYQVIFYDKTKNTVFGSATLFRLEEYKLPEFKVSVQMPEENGKKKTFRLGEKVTVNIQADYYFGGPVANADVEVVVTQNPLYHYWTRPHEYPWFYDNMTQGFQGGRYYGGQGPVIKREPLKTDATGKASLTFDTPQDSGQDLEYSIEARVTDASRREITGNGTARVTRERYYVYPEPAHNLYRPQDKVTVNFKAQDANDQPVQTAGTVKVTRDYWYEVWFAPDGHEVKGAELAQWQARNAIFPPVPPPGNAPWRLKFRGYEHDAILTQTVKTDTNGEAELTFTPERDGYYRVAWTSDDDADTNAPPGPPVTAETTVWVATTATTELGYRHGGMEIVVDKDTFRVGQTAPVMLSVPTGDRYVLFTVEGENLLSYQLVHVTGTVKLIELPIEEKHVPNIFLGAELVSDRQIFEDTKEVVVPPTKNFLTVDVKSDREQYQPQEEGTFTITTLDDNRKPVPAEVSFGLTDEAVFYIQSDYAGDPRQFFFGDKRAHEVQTQSTFNQKSYARLVEWEKGELIDERDRDQRQAMNSLHGMDYNNYYKLGDAEDGELDSSGVVSLRKDMNGRSRGYGFGGAIGGGGGGVFTVNGAVDAVAGAMPTTALAAAENPSSMPMAPMPAIEAMEKNKAPGGGAEPAVQVRSDFRSTIFWQPDVKTGADGKATVKVKYPDSLTGWQATARAVTEGNQFGIATTNTRTKEPLIVRLEAPRFFVAGDTVTISAVVNNNTEGELTARVQLDPTVPGFAVKDAMVAELKVPANGEARADWEIPFHEAGDVSLKVTARGGKYADAMEKSYTVYEHGIEKFISKPGKVRGDDVTVKLELPKERREGSTTLSVQVTPSLAVTMLDALPYLINYPYGCTEQTMSRFLPTAITAKTLQDTGLSAEEAMHHVFGGIEKNSAAATHPDGKQDMQKLADMEKASLERLYDFQHGDGGWGWWKEGESDHWMTAYVVWGLSLARDAGINVHEDALRHGAEYLDKRLVEEDKNYDLQAWMLHALSAEQVTFKEKGTGRFEATAMDNLWTNRDQLNAYTRALFILAAHNYSSDDRAKTLVENLENGVKLDNAPDTSVVMQGPQQSSASVMGTAHWGADGIYWHWSESGVESTAFALRALLAVDPTNKLVEPVCNWLIKNRRGAQWNNTRDTAITVLAMNDYLRASGELSPELEYEVLVNGESIAKKKVTPADAFNAPSQFAVDPKLIRDGENDVRIVRRSGSGAIYFAANAEFYSQEEPVTAAGNEIFVRRQYYKLAGRPTLLKGYVYDREPLNDGESVKSGERVETVVTIDAKNDYEYLLFEDLKPAGFEAVEIRSGQSLYANELKSGAVAQKMGAAATNTTSSLSYEVKAGDSLSGIARDHGTTVRAIQRANGLTNARLNVGQELMIPMRRPVVDNSDYTGRERWVYEELRDRKVALFIDKLPQGVWEIKYDYRAETPGDFHALPVMGRAMYVPEIRCNGQEVRVKVEEKAGE
jgi:uncharacterized protein YfaS (alpha-2-macroglobulin family)/tetratricopeptide (TPR) repeat protein